MAETPVENETLKKRVWDEIATVEDPEIGMSLTELGLVYDLKIDENNKADVTMTFTSMGCPYGPQLKAEVHAAATRVDGSIIARRSSPTRAKTVAAVAGAGAAASTATVAARPPSTRVRGWTRRAAVCAELSMR